MKPIKVSQLNNYIKRILQSDPLLGNISVKGEISNLKYHGTGHVYFTLKDESSKISCFLPSDKVKYLHYELEDGMEIIVSGYIYLYDKGGTYSINVGDVIVEGAGNLTVAFEKLKEKLLKEGLFDGRYKKQLPEFPNKIAVITSDTGAAIKDIIKTIQNKNQFVDIIVYPCLVQGTSAAADISEAIDAVNRLFPDVDIIILGRGGGSLEELWAFNEEIVARSIFKSKCPVISAVGHETDFTISDFVADLRAATPTAAAEIAVPDINNLKMKLKNYNPQILKVEIESKINEYSFKLDNIVNRMSQILKDRIYSQELQLAKIRSTIDSINPKYIMEIGYGAIIDQDGLLIKSISPVKKGDLIKIIMADGRLDCIVEDKEGSGLYEFKEKSNI